MSGNSYKRTGRNLQLWEEQERKGRQVGAGGGLDEKRPTFTNLQDSPMWLKHSESSQAQHESVHKTDSDEWDSPAANLIGNVLA